MNTLVLKAGLSDLTYSCIASGEERARFNGKIRDYRGNSDDETSVRTALRHISTETLAADRVPDVIAIRVPFGGSEFPGPAIADETTIEKLKKLVRYAPLHIPPALTVCKCLAEVFPGTPAAFVFDTSFFANLPPREYRYAIDDEMNGELGLRRYGFHGVFHKAACSKVVRTWRKKHPGVAPRILSICLEPQPEVAAVIGLRPVTTTSGITPLEGIPGETTCGDLDPSVVLDLSRRRKWGAQQIDLELTGRSGLSGLAGRRVTLDEVLTSGQHDLSLANEVLQYRILQACGAGMAAMGGVDAITFSGRYAGVSWVLARWIAANLTFEGAPGKPAIEMECIEQSLDTLIAEEATALLLTLRHNVPHEVST